MILGASPGVAMSHGKTFHPAQFNEKMLIHVDVVTYTKLVSAQSGCDKKTCLLWFNCNNRTKTNHHCLPGSVVKGFTNMIEVRSPSSACEIVFGSQRRFEAVPANMNILFWEKVAVIIRPSMRPVFVKKVKRC